MFCVAPSRWIKINEPCRGEHGAIPNPLCGTYFSNSMNRKLVKCILVFRWIYHFANTFLASLWRRRFYTQSTKYFSINIVCSLREFRVPRWSAVGRENLRYNPERSGDDDLWSCRSFWNPRILKYPHFVCTAARFALQYFSGSLCTCMRVPHLKPPTRYKNSQYRHTRYRPLIKEIISSR